MATFSIVNTFTSATSFILIAFSLTLFLFYYLKRTFSYWERRGVPYAKPSLLFGNTKDVTLQRAPPALVFQQVYKELDGHKFGGFYRGATPFLLLRDPEVIRTFLVKSFSHFHDHGTYLDEELDPLAANIVNLTGERWRNVRYKLTPTFSSGKLRLMQDLMSDCINELNDYMTNVTSDDSSGVQNLCELAEKITTDITGSCIFGLRCNALRDENSEFKRVMVSFKKPSYRSYFRNLFRFTNPRLISFFKVKEVPPEVDEFFMSVLREAVEYRETTAQKRNDFLQLLIDIQAEEKKQLQRNGHHQQNGTKIREEHLGKKSTESTSDILFTDKIIVANAYVFFVGGFEGTVMTISCCLYEMALNPVIYNKVSDEIESVKRANNNNLDYNALKQLVYLESVIFESLRKYPPTPLLGRECTKPFQIPDTSIVIEKGININICTYALHHDPQYFPEPEKFIPERFSEENKHSIKPFTYLPFGDGPRMCIGMRFAMFAMKSVLSHLVSNFTVHACEKTVVPLKFNCRSRNHKAEGGIWVQFQRKAK